MIPPGTGTRVSRLLVESAVFGDRSEVSPWSP
jgi:hypothetical protein